MIKNRFIYLLSVASLLCACNNHSEKKASEKNTDPQEEVTYFPVSNFLGGQILQIKEKGISPQKISIINGKSDTLFIKASDLDAALADFTNPFIDSVSTYTCYTSKKFFDQTLNSITLTYEAKQPIPSNLPWLSWNIYINPETEKVEMIYLVKKISPSLIKQLTWKASKKYCKIISINNDSSNSSSNQEVTIKWDY